MGLIEKLDDIGKPALDRADGPELHPVLADRPRPSRLSEMEWTHVLLEALRSLEHAGRPHRAREEFRGWKRRQSLGPHAGSSGNVAFDEYREETLRKLDEEQREFRDFLDRLRAAKDRAEFDEFMAERRNRPAPETPPAPSRRLSLSRPEACFDRRNLSDRRRPRLDRGRFSFQWSSFIGRCSSGPRCAQFSRVTAKA